MCGIIKVSRRRNTKQSRVKLLLFGNYIVTISDTVLKTHSNLRIFLAILVIFLLVCSIFFYSPDVAVDFGREVIFCFDFESEALGVFFLRGPFDIVIIYSLQYTYTFLIVKSRASRFLIF